MKRRVYYQSRHNTSLFFLLNNFFCFILHLYNIVIPIINSVKSVNLRSLVMASRNIVMPRCYDQLCISLCGDPTLTTIRIVVHGFCSLFLYHNTEAPFLWRKFVSGGRVTLPEEPWASQLLIQFLSKSGGTLQNKVRSATRVARLALSKCKFHCIANTNSVE